MRDLIIEPAWKETDLGMPLPEDRHAVSVCLPTWDSIIGYEEGRERVISKLRCGYPRFFKHPAIERLFKECASAVALEGESVVVFPHRAAAQRALRFVEKRNGEALRIAGYDGLQVLVGSEAACKLAMEYWRYTGEIVSSRQALDVIDGDGLWKYDASDLLRRLEEYGGYGEGDVYLYESGMSAIYAVHRSLCKPNPGKKTLQLDFPYVDALKVQNSFGPGAVFLNDATGELLDEALNRIRKGEFSAVFCEVPSNPLLRSVDLRRVSEACREGSVPLVVDDTVSSCYNVNVKPYADVITTSLTKWISGKGDVMAGAVQLVKSSAFYSELSAFFNEDCEDGSKLYASDAAVLDENSKQFPERMPIVNKSTDAIVKYLMDHDAVAQVWFTNGETKKQYDQVKKANGGYGGLFSFRLKNDKKAAKFYDLLEISKGPSMGAEFSLVSPYTLLAHYDELEWAEGCGVPKNLIRVSVGIEPQGILLKRIKSALEAI